MTWKHLGVERPGVLISPGVLPSGTLQNLTVVEAKRSAGCPSLSFFPDECAVRNWIILLGFSYLFV